MARKKSLQTSFSAGELAPEVAMRQDTDQYQNGAKSLLNRRMLIGGGHVRRPGSWLESELSTDPVIAEFIVNQTTQYVLSFTAGAMHAYVRDVDTGHLTASGSITGGPWTGTIYQEMDWVQRGNVIFLSHVSMPTQRIERTGAASWARTSLAFTLGPGGRPEQPYLKVAAAAVTLQPSATSGSVTLTSSSAVFVGAHVGQYIRYLSKTMLITAFTDSTHVTATVVEGLPGTQTLTVTSSGGFLVGDVVEGSTSGAHAQVTGIPDGTHLTVVIIQGLIPFAVETIIGPNGSTSISAVASAAPAAVEDWDEQIFGPVYGYPACIEIHRNRLLFGGHPAAPNYLIASVIGDLYNFNVGTGADADAIIESIGDAGASKIVQLCSAEQLLVLTDRGPYYVAEGPTNPFRASSISFQPFGSPWPVNSTAQVQAFDSGAVMVSGSLIVKARQTGNTSALWDADEVSLLSPHLIDTPDRLAVISNFGGDPERYAIFRNSDGTLAVLQLVEAQKIRNFTPWTTDGNYLSVASIAGDLYAAVERTVDNQTKYFLELFDQDITLDCAVRYATTAAMDAGVPAQYGDTTVNVVTPDYHLGEWPITLRTMPAGPYTVGLYYTSTTEILPPIIAGQEGPMAGDYMRIVEAYVHVLSSARFSAEGFTLSAYQGSDDISQPPPLKNGPQRFQFMGWAREPTITITQADPLPLKILAVKTIVAF
ncbi:hypothetical protein IVB03_39540 [Bradyrhizobium sp. 168]|uniref:hypothetical protein n=1 Tax=Bradyrhizobium sp. 168 TaxID=2782639 RepID=UPI001FF94B25|nr:hypothetical protein [Bradyrhizobium sp. 168]MCK1585490.1 hypothetical protein [Bradyrhizobium sp. 168]